MSRSLRLAFLAAVTAALPASAGIIPVQQTIAIDGNAADWQQVLLNPANSTWDGEGAAVQCAYSTDRDCAVSGSQHDLARFGWTWDATSFYVYAERFHNGAPWAYFEVYFDASYDGLLQTGEPAFLLRLNSAGTSADWQRGFYRAVSAFGDPLEDAQLHADGYDMPGTIQTLGSFPATQSGPVAGGLIWEGSVRWTDLGLGAAGPMYFHASSSDTTNVPASLRDNVGGTGGRSGDTGFRSLTLSASSTGSAGPSQTTRLSHEACNYGNIASRVDLRAISAQGFDVTFWRDDDSDGSPDVYLGRDAGGDGDFSRSRDDLATAGDTDSDGRLDLGVLAAGTCVTFILQQTYPSNSNDTLEQIQVHVELQDARTELAERVDSIYIGKITLRADEARVGTPGDFAWLPHALRNNTSSAERVDLKAVSPRGWTYTFWTDPEGDSQPGPSSVQLFDADGSGYPDLGIVAGEEVRFLVRALIPVAAVSGQSDAATIQAMVQGNVRDSVLDVTTASGPVEVTPDHTLANRDERYGAAGGSIYFPHVIRNARGAADSYDLVATSDIGWPVTLLADPDGDGRPYDSFTLPGMSGSVPPSGGTYPLIARVDVPAGSSTGSHAVVTVRATSRADGVTTDAATDDAFAAIVRVHEDPAHVINISQAPPCSTVYAQANGLQALSPDYRFVWRRTGGGSQRVTVVQVDSLGRAEDQLLLPSTGMGPDWSVDIQQLQGGTWVNLDSAYFDVLDPVVLRSLQPTQSSFDVAAPALTATAQFQNTSQSRQILNMPIRWVLLTPDRTRYLRSNGNFASYSGTEATATETLSFAAGESRTRFLSVTAPAFPSEGSYVLEIWQGASCGAEFLAGSTTVLVADDADGDGLRRSAEIAAGTNPLDADSDDDGVLDAADGLTDSDGDGLIDALDCDSDDDLLLDGTESGVWDLPPSTNPAAGCWRRDSWPGDTTNPRNRDTDGGGVPDGIEDSDHDGLRDASETNPLDPADDSTADTDGDGLQDVGENLLGTNPLDADSDDDGVSDGVEATFDSDGDGRNDALQCDSDGDGLTDGQERGVTIPAIGTDASAGCFRPDVDPTTITNPRAADSDGGGVDDGDEDADRNGRIDAGETDPAVADDDDADGDGLDLLTETALGTSPLDDDSDDDGVADGAERADLSGDGTPDALQCDSDGDGLSDGLEAGLTAARSGTDLAAGCFRADADPSTRTDPALRDSDGGGTDDGSEDLNRDGRRDSGEGDPLAEGDDDPDRDGLSNASEDALGTARRDADSDDDGVSDGIEAADGSGDGMTDALQCDADLDGLGDGLERGLDAPLADTNVAAGCFVADADPSTTTDPAASDTDGGGIGDGGEDLDRNGRVDAGETNPADGGDEDPDGDRLINRDEDALGTSRRDGDSDDDGLSDFAEGSGDADGNLVPDALSCDSDGDGLKDSVEAGLTSGLTDTDLAAGCFVADADPSTTTDPRRGDTDGGGVSDGLEDADHDGLRDGGERDPNDASDDACGQAVPGEVQGVRVSKQGTAARIAWTPITGEACLSYNVYRSEALPGLTPLGAGIGASELIDGSAMTGAVRFYVVTAVTPAGEGPTGLR